MNRDCKKALARIARLCRENIAAFGPTYDPRWPRIHGPGPQMKGAKSEGNGVTDMAREILTEIRLIRREHRRSNASVRFGHTPPKRTMDMGNKRKSAAGGRTSRPRGSAGLGPVRATGRGFELIEFADKYGEPCSLQQSSLAEYAKPGTSAVWLGCEQACCTPQGEPLSPRMHLDRKQVAALIAHLQRWLVADTFSLPNGGGEGRAVARTSPPPGSVSESKGETR